MDQSQTPGIGRTVPFGSGLNPLLSGGADGSVTLACRLGFRSSEALCIL